MIYYIDYAVEMTKESYESLQREIGAADDYLRDELKRLVESGIRAGHEFSDGRRVLRWDGVGFIKTDEAWVVLDDIIHDLNGKDEEGVARIWLGGL